MLFLYLFIANLAVCSELMFCFNLFFKKFDASHIGLFVNEEADTADKALKLTLIFSQNPPLDLRPIVNSYISKKWQTEQCIHNKLHEISLVLNKRPSFCPSNADTIRPYTHDAVFSTRHLHMHSEQ